jgi:histidinol phosphatase-like PHP family hydrolase
MPPLDVLVLADPHFVGTAASAGAAAGRDTCLGRILLRKALARLRHLGVEPGLIVLAGDLVEDGTRPGAADDLLALAGEIRRTGIPLLAVPGNHDGDPAPVARVFDCPAGVHVVGDYAFLLFHERRVAGEVFERPAEQLAWPAAAAAAHPDRPLVALQHHPFAPGIVSDYPYYLANREEVMRGYAAAGVWLSLSGHFHAGQPEHVEGGVTYRTAPALCEAPYRFLHVRLEGRAATVTAHALRVDVPGLTDCHCHTEMAYCATTVTASDDVRLARALGVSTLCLTEHTFQLYFPKDEAWSFRWQSDPSRREAAWKTPARGRMAAYRSLAAAFRDPPRVLAGLEVDLCFDGTLLLATEDAGGWDLIVGGIHEIAGFVRGQTTQEEAEMMFLRDVQRLLDQGVDVLAHPFRFFARKGLRKPEHLYPVLANLLATGGVAAEINFHTNEPEPAFFRACAERGVRIALGSDSHELAEVGEFLPHVRVLEAAGIAPADYERVLFRPDETRP